MSNQINFNIASFSRSAPSIRECPNEDGLEVAFAGRSNAGKSSAINTLTNNGKLARTSKTPGRTQLINFFELGNNLHLVDLPGYGYAKVPLKMKQQWERNLTEYIELRKNLSGLVLVMDIRRPMQEFDTIMINKAVNAGMPVHILLTKMDKLKKGPANSTLLKVRDEIKAAKIEDLVSVQAFSSLKRQGLDVLKNKLTEWLLTEPELDASDAQILPNNPSAY